MNQELNIHADYANAVFVEDVMLLNTIYENFINGVITENQAIQIAGMIKTVDNHIEDMADYYDESVDSGVGIPTIPIPFTGVKIPSMDILLEYVRDDSDENPYTLLSRPVWDTTTTVGSVLESVYEEMVDIMNAFRQGEYCDNRYSIAAMAESASDVFGLDKSLLPYCEYCYAKNNTNLVDMSIIQGFLEEVFEAYNVGNMAPIPQLTGSTIQHMDIDDDDDDFDILEHQFESAEEYRFAVEEYLKESGVEEFCEAVIPKNYVPFDTEAKKLFDKLKPNIKDADNPDIFKNSLNVKKTRYAFPLLDNATEDVVRNAINSCGYTPTRENSRILNYKKKVQNMNLTILFDDVASGVTISYELDSAKNTNESAYMESFENMEMGLEVPDNHYILEAVLDAVEYDYTDAVFKLQNAEDYILSVKRNANIYVGEGYALWQKAKANYDNAVKEYEEILERGNHFPAEPPQFKIYEAGEKEIRNNDKIDEGIKDILVKLNKLGYKTKYSCTGHSRTRLARDGKNDGIYQGKLYTTARINFDKVYTFTTLPDGWYQSNDGDITSIYVKPCQYDKKDGDVSEAFDKWKHRYMNALDSWVDELPQAGKTKEDTAFESYIEDLERDFFASLG